MLMNKPTYKVYELNAETTKTKEIKIKYAKNYKKCMDWNMQDNTLISLNYSIDPIQSQTKYQQVFI